MILQTLFFFLKIAKVIWGLFWFHVNYRNIGSRFVKYLLIFRQRGREGEREGEKHQCVVASHVPTTGEPALNPGMCPDWELNQ